MSVSILQKLIIRAYDLFLGKWAEQGEPLVSTFSREMVDNNNNTVMTSAQAEALVAGGGGGTGPQGPAGATGATGPTGPMPKIGLFTIPLGADTVTVTGLGLSFTPTGCIAMVMRSSSENLNVAVSTVDYDTLSSDGFTCNLMGITVTADNVLAFILT